ncbi:hypothetical protein IW261DRAFT_991065 [Armillaria novae-zelandiae]|uniref:Uncharacterized protein n=1 Tax=Armillaria novae-zelandiae TaxID=153914 RepID=A0AA39PI11_9AGAR|nr:hypothetical protein IW261DRAFT_991065 [Armillaria novae-zelandiae]
MMFKFASIAMIAFTAMFLSVGQVNAAALTADNAVDACNGSNDYGVGHSCAFKQSQGVCRKNACGNLVCKV